MPPPQGSDLNRELQILEAEMKRLEAEYNMYFAGRLPRLPWENRARVDGLFKRYDRMHIQNTGDRFRFGTLQAKWASFCELWERQMKQAELGRPRFNRNRGPLPPGMSPSGEEAPEPSSGPVAPPPTPMPPQRPHDRIVGVTSFKDPGAQGDRMQELYSRLAQAKKDAGEQPVSYDKFKDLVRSQVDKLGSDGKEVAFRVAFKNGKVQLTAKTVKGE